MFFFCDIFKAFDRVWHKGLIFKLKQNGIEGAFLDWLADYLSNRKQCIVLNSTCSDLKEIQAGVSQGSVLGPLLFLVYVSDIADQLLSLTRLFADDSSLFFSCSNLNDIEGILKRIWYLSPMRAVSQEEPSDRKPDPWPF